MANNEEINKVPNEILKEIEDLSKKYTTIDTSWLKEELIGEYLLSPEIFPIILSLLKTRWFYETINGYDEKISKDILLIIKNTFYCKTYELYARFFRDDEKNKNILKEHSYDEQIIAKLFSTIFDQKKQREMKPNIRTCSGRGYKKVDSFKRI